MKPLPRPPSVYPNSHLNGASNGTNGSQPPPQAMQVQLVPPAAGQADDLELRRFLELVRRRAVEILGVAAIVTSAATVMTLTKEPAYEGYFRLLVEPVNVESNLSELAPTSDSLPTSIGMDYDTQIQVLQSPDLMESAIAQLQTQYPDLSYDALVSSLSIARLEETKIIEVRYQDNNPDEVRAVLEQLSATYLRYSLLERQTNLRNGIDFVQDQLRSLQERVDDLQTELQTFRQTYRFIDPDAQAQQIATQVSSLEQQQIALDQSLSQAVSRFNLLQGETGAVAALSTAPGYQDIVGELQQIEIEIAAERTRFQDRNPAIQALQQERANLLPLLRQEAERVVGEKLAEAATQIQLIEAQQQAIVQAQQQLDQTVRQLPVLSRQYTDLQRELQVAVQSLNRFQETRETLQTEAAQKEVPWQLITPPQQPGLVSGSSTRSLVLGLVAGILAGIGVAILLEKLDPVYHSVDDLKEKLKLPLLGTVPFQRNLRHQERSLAQKSVASDHDRMGSIDQVTALLNRVIPSASPSNFLEAIRVLYAHTQALKVGRPTRSIVISSAASGDGKTTIALHLAQAAATMGQRVLLIDANLRQPQIHSRCQLPNQQGLSDLLAENLPVKNLLQRPLPNRNLYVITAGQQLADPTELLSSHKMQQLMLKCHTTFDLVIYDTPAIAGLADAALLAAHTTGLMLVVRRGKTDRSVLEQAIDSLKLSHTPVLGYVANG